MEFAGNITSAGSNRLSPDIRRWPLRSFTAALTTKAIILKARWDLGFRRLSIIDLAGGHQPMSDQEESVWVVFNGEIYNYLEVKQELEGIWPPIPHLTPTLRSSSTVTSSGDLKFSTILTACLGWRSGMSERKRLVLARDAFGIKLVYYKIDNGSLSFGSEIRAVRATSDERTEIDPIALNLFLRYRFTPSPYTIYQGIQKLAPGTMLVAEPGSSRVQRWYKFRPEPFSPMPTDKQAAEELLDIYRRAMKRHLLSDVPVGLLLSGGLDSGLLLGLMNERGREWPTFTIGYGSGFKDDELVDAAETAKIFHSRHTAIEINQQVFEESFPRIVSCLEEPVAASSIVPMYFVSERARQSVTVALNGQGPDELFGGYTRHLGVHYGGVWASLPTWLRGPVASGIRSLPRAEALRRGLYSLDVQDRMRRYQQVFSIASEEGIDGMFHHDLLPAGTGDRILESWSDLVPLMENTDELGGLQFIELRSTLPDELLMYADKLSMAHSLEVRVPYLDREVVEYVERLKATFKVRNGVRKWLHRSVCRSFLPARLLRRKKRGFAVNVVDEWFRHSRSPIVDEMFKDSSSIIYRFLRPDSVRKLLSEHQSGQRNHYKLLFSLLVSETLMRESCNGYATQTATPVAGGT